MKPVGLALGWAGYTLAYFGICSLRGPGVGLFDLIIPGRTVVIPMAAVDAKSHPGPGGAVYHAPGDTAYWNSPEGKAIASGKPIPKAIWDKIVAQQVASGARNP